MLAVDDVSAQTCTTQNTSCVATAGETVTIDPASTITTSGSNAPVLATGSGATITGDQTTVVHTGTGTTPAVHATDGGSITLTNGAITNFGGSTTGGVVADASGSVTLTNTTIETDGDLLHGLYPGSGGTITMNGGSIVTHGFNAYGVWARIGSTVTLNGTSITTSTTDDYGVGIASVGAGTTVIANNGFSITTSGVWAYGAWAFNGEVKLTDGTINTAGPQAYGLYSSAGSSVLTGERITVTSEEEALRVEGGTTTLTDSTLTSTTTTAITGTGAAQVTLRGSTQVNSATGLLMSYVAAAGTTASLTIDGANLSGDVQQTGAVGPTDGLEVDIINNGVWTGTADGVRLVSMASGGVWNVTGAPVLGGVAFDAGTMRFNGAFSVDAPVDLQSGGGTVDTNGFNAALTGTVSGSGALTKTGSGILTLSGTNDFSGGTTVNGGTAQAASAGSAFGSGILTVNAGGIANLDGFDTTAGGLQGAGPVTLEGGTLTLDQDADTVFSGVISDSVGTAGLVKNGVGTLQLTGVNTYAGPTTINDGTIRIDGSITSPVTINASGTLSGFGTVFGDVSNAGNVMPGSGGASGALTVTGAYVGNGGRLTINSVLGNSASPTSQLVLSGAGASASGNTNVVVNNLGGTGGQTTGTGIPIIVAAGGATTTSGAFTLAGPVVAGLYQYQLFRGPVAGGSADAQNSWYLRSHIDGPGPSPVPTYRPEGAIFGAMPSLGRELTRTAIGTFHDYNGDQQLLRGNGAPTRAWGRVFGQTIEQGHAGLLSPNFKGQVYGFQTGVDLYETETASDFNDRFGVFFSYAHARGDVRGFALGVQNAAAGNTTLEGLSGGAYWTRVGPREEYIEARVMGTHYSGDGTSLANNITVNVKGTSFAASLEGGVPIRLGQLTVEPQAQVIYQYLDMNGSDPFASIAYDTPDALYARVGLRLSGDGLLGLSNVRPYLKANLWQDMVGTDKAIFSRTDIVDTGFRSTAIEVGGGLVAQLNQYASVWGMMDYTTDVDGRQDREIIRGNIGMKLTW